MHICMCQNFSTQTHSSPEGDRQEVALTPFQYKQHVKKLKSAIAPKSLPNIPTSASGSECPQILLDKPFPSGYSQLSQNTFSTPRGLYSTAQKPYSGSQNLPPQDLGMIICAIKYLRYNMPRSHSCILNPSLNLLIKFSISSLCGHPSPAFHIPQDLSTIFEHLQLEPVIESYICCPQCFFLDCLTESVTTNQTHFQHHNEKNHHDCPCTKSLGKLIYSFEPCTQNTTKMKETFIPKKHGIYQPFKNWLSIFLQCAGIIWVWRHFTCTRNVNDPQFISIPGALAFSIYLDWFIAHQNSTWLASIGPMMLICLNLPPSERLKPENVCVAGIIPGPKEPTSLQFNYLLMPLIQELKELWQVCHFHPPQQVLQDCLSVLPSSQPLRMWFPFSSLLYLFLIQATTFGIFALFTKLKWKKLVLNFTTHSHTQIINQQLQAGFGQPQNNNKQFCLSMECNIQFWKTFCIWMQPEWLILT
ncbi:hypothetical protein O181_028438 [Austropuccinia psidii MF-1]|uniref:Uncharacterized protein n=1 Tax=Austropuccinia psidii MF-1 TaxID=1389203 RepID=A0A9Q3H1U0_9BASI|nr:hypothetical protein [Austropuccinia psidii MF-1]